MPSLIDIRRRVRSVKNTQQITKAMKMVSAAKLRRAQERVIAARPYAAMLEKMLASVSGAARGNDQAGELPEIPSLSKVWLIAEWHEREAYDLMGITFTGHPNLRRILCPEDWEGHPLRKDYEFPLEYHGIRGQ